MIKILNVGKCIINYIYLDCFVRYVVLHRNKTKKKQHYAIINKGKIYIEQ